MGLHDNRLEAEGDACGDGDVTAKWRSGLFIAAKAAMLYFDAEAKRRRLGKEERRVRRMLKQATKGGGNG